MPIKEKFVEIFDAKGNPGGNSLPFYGDNHAPNGEWLYSEKSTPTNRIQKTLRNGARLVIVDPELVPTDLERASGTPLHECKDGENYFNKNGYCRVWLYDSASGHGVPIVPGQPDSWCELAHLRLAKKLNFFQKLWEYIKSWFD